jgi:hypothetical protein
VRNLRERDIEAYLVKQVKATGGLVRKVQWPGRRGAPDRLVSWPARLGGRGPLFVELKAPGEKLDDHQEHEHALMRAFGMSVIVIDSFDGVIALVEGRSQ